MLTGGINAENAPILVEFPTLPLLELFKGRGHGNGKEKGKKEKGTTCADGIGVENSVLGWI